MIYLDTSVVLATLFNEPRRLPDTVWAKRLFSSRLLEYEVAVRMNALGGPPQALELAKEFLENVHLIELTRPVLERVLQPFTVSLRTLDALHLATLIYLVGRGLDLELATFDQRLAGAAKASGIRLASI